MSKKDILDLLEDGAELAEAAATAVAVVEPITGLAGKLAFKSIIDRLRTARTRR